MKRLWDALFGRRRSKEDRSEAAHQEPAPSEPANRSPRPVLYFAGSSLDERRMLYYRLRCPYGVISRHGHLEIVRSRRDYPIMQAMEVDGRRFVVRLMDRHRLFRDIDSPPAEDALFLPESTRMGFVESYRRSTPGRCVMHVPRCMDTGRCIYLFFNTDGSAFAIHLRFRDDMRVVRWAIEYETIPFRWNDLRPANFVFSAPVEQLREFYEKLFIERIDPQLRAPYLSHDDLEDIPPPWESDPPQDLSEDIPLSWLSGSEQELRCLAHAICCTEPGMFDVPEPVTVVYRATRVDKRGGFLYVKRGEDRLTNPRLMSLCDLAFRLNTFIGTKWKGGRRQYELQKAAMRVQVTVEPPSAHEKAEAFLTLVDWLDDKLHDPEKRAQFGLPPRPAANEEMAPEKPTAT